MGESDLVGRGTKLVSKVFGRWNHVTMLWIISMAPTYMTRIFFILSCIADQTNKLPIDLVLHVQTENVMPNFLPPPFDYLCSHSPYPQTLAGSRTFLKLNKLRGYINPKKFQGIG